MPATKKQREQNRGINVDSTTLNESSASLPDSQSHTCEKLSSKLKAVLLAKAPEAVPAFLRLCRPRDVEMKPSQRLLHTESLVTNVLDTLKVEARPVEVYRMGKPEVEEQDGYVNKINTDLSLFANRMTLEERIKFKQLRKDAYERNQREHNGNKVYVVYKDMVVKACDIPSIRQSSVPKN
ncbi:hypothetical protein Aduo_002786 [Ancylostoma duodenale]